MSRFLFTVPVLAVANEHVSVSPDGQVHFEDVMDSNQFIADGAGIDLEESFSQVEETFHEEIFGRSARRN